MEWIKIFSSVGEMKLAVVSGQPRLLVVNGKRICLVRNEEQLLAVEDRCPHNGESLSRGTVNYLGDVICPLHGYRFNSRTGRECNQRTRDLDVYSIKEQNGEVFIGI